MLNARNTSSTKQRGKVTEDIKNSLVVWSQDQHQKCIQVSPSINQDKAISLYSGYKTRLDKKVTRFQNFSLVRDGSINLKNENIYTMSN